MSRAPIAGRTRTARTPGPARALALLLLVVPAVGAANDWPQFRYNETHQGAVPAPANNVFGPFAENWWGNVTVPGPTSSPVIAGGVVYLGDADGTLHALELSTGKELWKNSTGGKPIMGAPAVGPSHVYAVTDAGQIYAFHRQTGRPEPGYPIATAATRGGLLLHEDILYVGGSDGILRSYFASTQSQRWTFQSRATFTFGNQSVTCSGGGIESTPAVFENLVLFGSTNYCFYAVKKSPGGTSGSAVWVYRASEAVRSSPAIDLTFRRVLFGDVNGWVHAINVESAGVVSTPAWRFQEPVSSQGVTSEVRASPAIWDGKAIIAASNGNVRALPLAASANSTTYVWARSLGGSVTASPAVGNGYVLVGTFEGKMFMLRATTGDVVDTRTAPEPIETSAAISGSQAVWASRDGAVFGWGGSRGARPDLALQSVEATTMVERAEGAVNGTVRNVGGQSSPATRVTLFVGQSDAGSQDLPGLAPGVGATFRLPWTPPLDGPFTLRVAVDPLNAIDESNETNNAATIVLTAHPAANTTTPSSTSVPPRADGKGLLAEPGLALAALAALAVVAARRRRGNG